jgi:hypothetical protein
MLTKTSTCHDILQEILLNAYIMGENSKEITIIEIIEDMKQKLLPIFKSLNDV